MHYDMSIGGINKLSTAHFSVHEETPNKRLRLPSLFSESNASLQERLNQLTKPLNHQSSEFSILRQGVSVRHTEPLASGDNSSSTQIIHQESQDKFMTIA